MPVEELTVDTLTIRDGPFATQGHRVNGDLYYGISRKVTYPLQENQLFFNPSPRVKIPTPKNSAARKKKHFVSDHALLYFPDYRAATSPVHHRANITKARAQGGMPSDLRGARVAFYQARGESLHLTVKR